MRQGQQVRRLRTFVLAVGMAVLMGCGGSTPPPSPPTTQTTISALGRLYGEYASRHDGVGPADEATFRSFIESLPEPQRKSSGLEDLSVALVSPRDGAAYVILYGIEPQKTSVPDGQPNAPSAAGKTGLRGQPIVIYEETGLNGKRFVATAFGTLDELSEADFAQAIP